MSVRSFAHSMSKDTLDTSGLPFTTSSSFGQMVVNSWCIACLASNKGQDCYQPREAILKGKAGSVQKRSAGGEEHTVTPSDNTCTRWQMSYIVVLFTCLKALTQPRKSARPRR